MIEAKIRRYTQQPQARITDYFDFFAGTSTGAFLTALMLAPQQQMTRTSESPIDGNRLVEIYHYYGPQIFSNTWQHQIRTLWGLFGPLYPVDVFEALLIERLGEIKLSHLTKPCIFPAYDMTGRQSVFFTQHTAGRTDPDYPLWQVIRAATAAPTYFQPISMQIEERPTKLTRRQKGGAALIDGGVIANDPAMFGYVEAKKLFRPSPAANDMLVVSLGTGRVHTSYSYAKSKRWGAVQWIDPILDVLTSASSETVSYEVQKLFDSEAAADQYFRFQLDLPEDKSRMDDASPKILQFWDDSAKQMAVRYEEAIDYLIPLLVEQSDANVDLRMRIDEFGK